MLAQHAGDVDGARELVRLHADQTDHAEIAVLAEQLDDIIDPDPGVGLVEGCDVDLDVGTQHLPVAGVVGERIDASNT